MLCVVTVSTCKMGKASCCFLQRTSHIIRQLWYLLCAKHIGVSIFSKKQSCVLYHIAAHVIGIHNTGKLSVI